MRVLFNFSAVLSDGMRHNAAFIADGSSVWTGVMQGLSGGWSDLGEVPQDGSFRTQLDVSSTATALGARMVGGVVSENIVGGKHRAAWKADKGLPSTYKGLIKAGKLTQAQFKALVAFYAVETEAAA